MSIQPQLAAGLTLLVALLGSPVPVLAPALAQVLEDVEIEGPISAVTADTITIMGITVQVPGGKAATPTNPEVALPALLDPLPGRPQGFLGGTAIVEGSSLNGQITAATVFSDVNEHVLVGEATATDADPATLHVNGLEVRALTDPRIPAGPPLNELGFIIDRATIPPGTLVSADGYFSEADGALLYHTVVAEGELVNPGINEVSITRAQCEEGGAELEVRGGVHAPFPAGSGTPAPVTGRVQIQLASGTPVTGGFIVVEPDGDLPGFARYRFKNGNVALAKCPDVIKAVFMPVDSGTILASATAAVEVDEE